MDFTCVNCSRLTTVDFTSDDLTIYRCDICDMEYRLITGRIEKPTAQRIRIGDAKSMKGSNEFNAMPIKVEIKRR